MRPDVIQRLPWLALLAAGAAALGPGCVPGKGQVSLYGDGILGALDKSGPAEINAPADGPRAGAEVSTSDGGAAPATDLPPLSKPDAKPGAPPPPYGSTVGVTALDFSDIPDCDGKLYRLYDYYGKGKGVLIAMQSPT